ncbi:2-oxo-4-hydroxy-4-carboxy-5-ureidoimidazoline decarboxylase [Klenkia terrae]|uniref:2-oxo-4-hydroxy-4-carboxy-5-ureidoimidazoline decarboxylase n=1 Tax=Klenkia terrae TaxID=1052259 RepID=A0ABU8E8R8_9ACTN|nr:2-oxo-4-hydroxy-4-carboxy-5-ureidoimidazoline decarboxylase [Klenkia terrae]
MDLSSFSAASLDEVTEALRACNAARSFAPTVAAGRPYPSVDALVARAGEVSRALPWDEVAQALAAHPRIGDRVSGDSAEAASSRREQSSMSSAADDVRDALLQGNRDYEDRFDHVFLIRAAGRTPEEMLAELRRRLAHPPEQERPEVLEQLAQITELRVRGLVS